jgi:hypothetical protein
VLVLTPPPEGMVVLGVVVVVVGVLNMVRIGLDFRDAYLESGQVVCEWWLVSVGRCFPCPMSKRGFCRMRFDKG